MKKDSPKQYTIRQVPSDVDRALRKKAREEQRSLNEVAIEALKTGAEILSPEMEFHDLDALAGTWVDDPKFDEAIKAQDKVDKQLWK